MTPHGAAHGGGGGAACSTPPDRPSVAPRRCAARPPGGRRRRIAFFFFQAEDGIRDYKVTGVQTCALPISMAQTALTLALGRVVQAAGAGCGMTLVRTIARDAYRAEHLIRVIAYLTMFSDRKSVV